MILSARDLEFMLFEWLDVEKLSDRPRFAEHDRESYDALLALCEQLATDHFATHYRKSDTEEPAFDGEKVRLIPWPMLHTGHSCRSGWRGRLVGQGAGLAPRHRHAHQRERTTDVGHAGRCLAEEEPPMTLVIGGTR